MSSKLQKRLEEARQKREETEQQIAAQTQSEGAIPKEDPEADLVPELNSSRSEEDQQMDKIMESIEILEAYHLWCGKMTPKISAGQRESIKISCPIPGHEDREPSAWINLDKGPGGVWHCGYCEQGGDKYTIAAYKFGYPVPTEGADYHALRRQMAEAKGWSFFSIPGKKELQITFPVEKSKEEPKLASVTLIQEDEDDDDDNSDDAFFYANTRSVNSAAFVKENTFLDKWINATRNDPTPDDYNFWIGLIAVSLAAGHNVRMKNSQKDVVGNLAVCLLGPSGVGKSRSIFHFYTLIEDTISKFNASFCPPKGIKVIKTPGSGEYLVQEFSEEYEPDPTSRIKELASVKALIEFNEFQQIASQMKRQGSTLGTRLMDLFDAPNTVQSGTRTYGRVEAYKPYATLLTTTQPSQLRRLINKDMVSSGFANRWIFPTGMPKDAPEFDEICTDLSSTYTYYSALNLWCDQTKIVTLTSDTRELANDFFIKNIKAATDKDETNLLKRLSLTMKKLLLLNAINEMEEVITPEMFIRSMSVLEYILGTYGVSSDRIGESHYQEIERCILDAIQRHEKNNPGKGITASEIRRKYHRRNFETKDIVTVLDYLTKSGDIAAAASQQGPGRRTTRYRMA